MSAQNGRFIRKGLPPEALELAGFFGAESFRLWQALTGRIEAAYPGVFTPDWSYGGQKHGWGWRYRKSKSFCTLIPERGGLTVLIVFGGVEREKMAGLLHGLNARFRKAYEDAHTYHDGKWVLHDVRSADDLGDVMVALTAKRRPKPAPAN
ncbi:MAG: DUF3788 domain-containing protein [Alphaproteobacteria bacterium]|nr:DUF3788 domain-containing protein [Alphaproteobacteria bacterium]